MRPSGRSVILEIMVKVTPELRKFGVRSLVVLGIVGVRVIKVPRIDFFLSNLLLLVGWAVGYFLSDLDDWVYALVTHPHELTSRRVRDLLSLGKWREAREMLIATREERERLPIHNAMTGLVVAGVGLWVISSSGSTLGSGVVLGLSVRLWWGMMRGEEYQRWYWMVARKMTLAEHKMIGGIWGVLVALQIVLLMRG